MKRSSIMAKVVSVLLVLTFAASQLYAVEMSYPSTDKLSPSLATDSTINPARSDSIQSDVIKKMEPGAIGNGIPLKDLVIGKLPALVQAEDTYNIGKVREAIKLAVVMARGYSKEEHAQIVTATIRNLINLNSSLDRNLHVFNSVVIGSEDYLLGFNRDNSVGLSRELIDRLSLVDLAQYIFHECAPEKDIVLKELKDERSQHRALYAEIQTEIFGKERVESLGKEFRALINEKVLAKAETASRRTFIGGNWKMAVDEAEAAVSLSHAIIASRLNHESPAGRSAEVVIAPSFIHIPKLNLSLLEEAKIGVAAQDISINESGAYTGQVSVRQLKDAGVKYVIIGHSERRRGETPESSELINKKAQTAIKNGLIPIICVGEDLKEYEAKKTNKVIEDQIRKSLAGLDMSKVVIAYEPVWAIGTGKAATAEQANEVQRYIRALLLDMFGYETAANTRILYGGSVKPGNINGFLAKPNIDGALVGGASLEGDAFFDIIKFSEGVDKEGLAGTEPSMSELFRPIQPSQELRYEFGAKQTSYTNTVTNVTVGPWLTKVKKHLPDSVVKTIRTSLEEAVKTGQLKGIDVNDYGASDIEIHVTHNYGPNNLAVQSLIYQAVIKALREAKENGYYKPYGGMDILRMPFEEQKKALKFRTGETTLLERGSEAVAKAKIIGGNSGAANIMLFNQFAVPGSTPVQKLGLDKSPGWRFVVQKTSDIVEGKLNPKEWSFEIKTTAGKAVGDKNDSIRLLTLLSQTNDYQIVAVYPVEGSALPAKEPVAQVIFHPVYDNGSWVLNPTILYRAQSGADAPGGIFNMAGKPSFVPGGLDGGHQVVIMPVTQKEARKAPPEGIAYVVMTGWQSRHDGEIPPVIEDHVAMNPPAYVPFQKLARYLARVMTSHGDMQPYLSPLEAEKRTEPIIEEFDNRFLPVPKETDIDPFLELMEKIIKDEGMVVVGDDKADMGGSFGHTRVPEYMIAVYKATVQEAVENGEVSDGNTFGIIDKNRVNDLENRGIGDDGHIVVLGDNSIYGKLTHQLSFRAFTRAFWYASVLGLKPYGLAQDYQGPEAKLAKAHPEEYSKLSERFFELLEQYLPQSELKQDNVNKAKAKWENWKMTGQSHKLEEKPFSGNVTQQGIGTVRYAFNPKTEKTFDIIAGDKTGPAALNLLIQEGVFNAADSKAFKNGLVFEIWDLKAYDKNDNIALKDIPKNFSDIEMLLMNLKDTKDRELVMVSYSNGTLRGDLTDAQKTGLAGLLKKACYIPNKRIFLDARQDRATIKILLAHSDRFNVRHVWTKKGKDFDSVSPIGYLDRIVLSSSVTKLGLLAGGEYVGKDDPVIAGNSVLMAYLHEFFRTRPLIVQGDMNGSHWEQITPCPLKEAVANLRSHPVFAAVRYTVSEDGKSMVEVEDIYGKKEYDKIRAQAHKFNVAFNDAQIGQFEPHGTNFRTVEASYPLQAEINRLETETSPFLVDNQKNVTPMGNVMKKVYEALPTVLAASESTNLDTVAADIQKNIFENRKDIFVAALTRTLATYPDKKFFMGVETDIGEAQRAQIMPLSKAIDEIENMVDKSGKRLFPNLTVKRGKANELVSMVTDMQKGGILNLNNAFIAARQASVESRAYEAIQGQGKAWITAISDLNAGDYLPVFESITLSMMAYLNADISAIKNFYDAISDKPIDPGVLQDMIRNRVIFILPRITKFDARQLREVYELAQQIYMAA